MICVFLWEIYGIVEQKLLICQSLQFEKCRSNQSENFENIICNLFHILQKCLSCFQKLNLLKLICIICLKMEISAFTEHTSLFAYWFVFMLVPKNWMLQFSYPQNTVQDIARTKRSLYILQMVKLADVYCHCINKSNDCYVLIFTHVTSVSSL